jgi:DNA processing protein
LSLARLRLARTEGVGPVTYRRLLARFGTAEAALEALPGLAAAGGRAGLAPVGAEAAERELAQIRKAGGRLLFLGEPDYPALLAMREDAPPAMAVFGDAALPAQRAVAVVGSRNASANGRRIAERLAGDLAQAGFHVVSGLARGIDAAAHEGVLRRQATGRTIACIAGGFDMPYPAENAGLQARIADAGAVLAEAPLGTAPQARHFPRRNRIIAGLSMGVVVVEAARQSGSLITARLALESDREVFAVPGSPLDPRNLGSNGLLRQGAHLTETADDVIAALRQGIARAELFGPAPVGFSEPPSQAESAAELSAAGLERAHQEILGLLGPAPTGVDDLIRRCQFSAGAVMSVLLDLEIAGRVEALPGSRFALLAEPGT